MAPAKAFSHEFCEVFKNTYLRTDASESVRYEVYILLSESLLEEEKEYKTEDNPWVFRQVICTCEQRYCKINYKYEMHTKTKSCYKNISCWLICSFIFFSFSSKNWFDIFHPTYLMNWNRSDFFKTLIKQKYFKFCCIATLSNLFDLTNLIKLIWPCISSNLSIVDWFK